MEIRYLKHYSSYLYREMEIKIYGHAGKPVLFIPCQGGRLFDFENFQMLDHWAHWIEEGKCTVYSIDTIDNETYANIEFAGYQNYYYLKNGKLYRSIREMNHDALGEEVKYIE